MRDPYVDCKHELVRETCRLLATAIYAHLVLYDCSTFELRTTSRRFMLSCSAAKLVRFDIDIHYCVAPSVV